MKLKAKRDYGSEKVSLLTKDRSYSGTFISNNAVNGKNEVTSKKEIKAFVFDDRGVWAEYDPTFFEPA